MVDTNSIRLILAGDVMTGRGIDQILPDAGEPQIYESYMRSAQGYVALAEERNGPIPHPVGFDYIWGQALATMEAREPACKIINLETAVTTSDNYWPGKGINYRMHPHNIACLKAARIDACSLANNHVLDWGYDGLTETLATLQTAGIQTAGAGLDRDRAWAPAAIPVGERRLLLFAFGHHSSGIPRDWAAGAKTAGVNFIGDLSAQSAQQICRCVETHRQANDLVAISIHWGGNWGYTIAREQREFAHRLIEKAGADLVYGHSSHHPLGIEIYRERLILYGCGDLINDYEGIGGHEEYRSELRLLYCADLDPASGILQRLELIPFAMRRFRLQAVSNEEREWLYQTLKRECRQLGSDLVPTETGECFLLRWGAH